MKTILHWIACHTVLIVLSLFVVVAVLFRGPLFGIWPQVEIVQTEAAPVEPVAEIQSKPLPAPIAEKVIPVSEPRYEAETKTVLAPETLIPEKPIQVKTAPAFHDEPIDMKLEDAPDISESIAVIKRETPENLKSQQNYQFRPPEEQSVETADTQEDLLQQARKSYWNDDLEKARRLYEAYIDLNPENPDGYGELGNLLSTVGDLDTAAQMYRRAAELLTRQGKTEQAQKLNEVLSSIEIIQNSPD